ncbi:hypothetical protein IP88_01715 [alpha proteobacterium AAP81b]|nr:hypothetical protein IP88_01715 [alpha proteobacterium AAP81b]
MTALAALLLAAPTLAQQAPLPGQGANPGIPGRPSIDNPDAAGQAPRSTARVDSDGALARAPCPLSESDVRVALTGVRFEGSGGQPLAPALAERLAGITVAAPGEQSIRIVCDLRDRANAALQEAGFIASVQIPPQEIADGNLRLVVVAARLTEVRVRGDVGRWRRQLAPRIAAIKALDPLNRFDVERILLLANDIPGVAMTLALRPSGGTAGEVIGDLTVQAQRGALIANVQNTGSKQIGPWIASLRGELYGLTGLADRTYVAFSNTLGDWNETHLVQIGHDFGIGTRGIRAGLRFSYADSNPQIPDFPLNSNSLIAGIDVSAPLLRRIDHDLGVTGGFELLNQRSVVRQGGREDPLFRDRLRIFFLRLDGNFRHLDSNGLPLWRVHGRVEARFGTDILGATKRGVSANGFQPSRFDGNPEAIVLRGEIEQDLALGRYFTLGASAFGQWANDPLLNLEEFSIGNLTYGRGYDPGSNGADRVIALRAEPRVRLPLFRKVGVELTGFFDYLRIYNLDPGAAEEENNRDLKSAGGGVRFTLPNRLVLDITYAQPLDKVLRNDEQRPPGRVLVTLTTKLLPWGAGR